MAYTIAKYSQDGFVVWGCVCGGGVLIGWCTVSRKSHLTCYYESGRLHPIKYQGATQCVECIDKVKDNKLFIALKIQMS